MSASLVGSEMCIRDSRVRTLGAVQGTLCGAPKGQGTAILAHPAPVVWPVSYTHLTLPTICSV
eukprot:14569606-Alexandrium_andersonii.AAC.1